MRHFTIKKNPAKNICLLLVGSEGAKNLKSRFENLAKSNEEDAKKRAEEERQRRQAREAREKEEQKKQQEVS